MCTARRVAAAELHRLQSSVGCRAQSAFGMACPIVVQKAIERVQLDVASPQDERLIASWLDWVASQEMAALQKCQSFDDCEESESQAKRQRISVAGSQNYTGRCHSPQQQSSELH